MTTISAKSILASRHALDHNIVGHTILCRYPRPIHAEVLTHKVFSRNAGSSRALPVKRLIQDVINDPFVPLYWGANQKGMQAGEEINTQVWVSDQIQPKRSRTRSLTREQAWERAMWLAIDMAEAFDAAGYHKQIVNRLLEPFSHITVLITSTQWSNFLALRDHPDAEPHIQILAREIRKAIEGADVRTLQPGQWHLPFITDEDRADLAGFYNPDEEAYQEGLRKLSVARCASTSYKTVEGFDMTLERALAIYDKLRTADILHASPFEHQFQMDEPGSGFHGKWLNEHLGGNLGPGVIQLRKTLPNECL